MLLFVLPLAVITAAFFGIWKALSVLSEASYIFSSLRLCLHSLTLSFRFLKGVYKILQVKVRWLGLLQTVVHVILLVNCNINWSYNLIACTPSCLHCI
jgi:hypothetical protein